MSAGDRPLAPLLLNHYRIRLEPSGEGGEQRLVFTSAVREVAIRGRRMDEFLQHVVPLLDGQHTPVEIVEETAAIFDAADLERTLGLLLQERLVVDAALSDERLGPQLSYLHEVGANPARVRGRLSKAHVSVVGVGAVGAVAATALAAAGVGQVRCIDDSVVSAADPYLAQLFELADVGSLRADVTRGNIRAINPDTAVDISAEPLVTAEDVARAVGGSDFVLGCLDPGLAAITDLVNGACLAQGIPASYGAATAFEGIVGPTVMPFETACYRCYQSRTVAAEDDPGAALRELQARFDGGVDLSAHRENTPFTAGIVGHLLALQVFQHLVGLWPRSVGRVLVVDFLTSGIAEHVVLRKPWCSACFAGPS